MAKLITSVGKGADVTGAEDDSNISTNAGKNQPITATPHTIDVDDQGETIEYLNASAIAVTLPTIASVTGSNIHTDDFTVTLKNVGAGAVTITRGGTDTFDDGSTSKALSQFEFIVIQTDSSLTKWNILPNDIDVATKTGTETLTNKTLTSPVINGTVTGTALLGSFLSDTSVTTTSGTSKDVTGIATWAKKITITFTNLLTSGSSLPVIQIGDSGGIETTGYISSSGSFYASGQISVVITNGYPILNRTFNTSPIHGTILLTLQNSSTNTWVVSGSLVTQGGEVGVTAGSKSLSAALDRLRITTSGGSDTFSSGAFTVMYEG